MEFVIPHFGRSNKSALLALSLGDATEGGSIAWGAYLEAQPYRLDVSLRVTAADSSAAMTMSPQGSTNALYPSWAPAGDEVAYLALVPQTSGFTQLYRQRVDGSPPTRILPEARAQYFPDWSPRGDLLAYEGVIASGQSAIWTLNPASPATTFRQITFLGGLATLPAFSPDGQGIAYVHRPGQSARWELRYIAADGTGERLLDSIPLPTVNVNARPCWDPTGSRLYVMNDAGKLYSVPKTGGRLAEVTSLGSPLSALEFHPGNGRLLLETSKPYPNRCHALSSTTTFSPDSAGANRIALLDTTAAHRDTSYRYVTRGPSLNRFPRYAPDGTRIAFTQLDVANAGVIGVGRITPDHAPILQPVADITASACVPVQFQLSAADPDGEPVSYRADELPPGATLSSYGSVLVGSRAGGHVLGRLPGHGRLGRRGQSRGQVHFRGQRFMRRPAR